MHINLDQILRDVWGKAIIERPATAATDTTPEKPAVEMTLGMVCASAFLTPVKGDEAVTGVEEKVTAYRMAKKFADGGTVDLTMEEIVAVRQRVAKVYVTAVAGPALEMLDAGSAPAEKPARRKA